MLTGVALRSLPANTGPNFTLNFSDDFTYADTTVPTGWSAYNTTTATLTHSYVVSNSLENYVDFSTNPRYSSLYRSAPAADLDIVVTLGGVTYQSPPASIHRFFGVRASTFSTTAGATYGLWANGYFIKFLTISSATAYLVKRVGHTETTLATFTLPATLNTALASNPVRFRLRAYGSSIKLRYWRSSSVEPTTWDVEVTDSSITGAGSITMGSSSTNNATVASMKALYDNFECWA